MLTQRVMEEKNIVDPGYNDQKVPSYLYLQH